MPTAKITSTTVDNAASVLTITELTGDQRAVVLIDRALPHRPFEVSVGQRSDITWLGGLAEGTFNVMGPQDFPSTMNGAWKDRFLGERTKEPIFQLNGEAIRTVRQAVALFESISQSGQLIEFTWFATKRRGLLKKFTQKWYTTHDVEWVCEFEWNSHGVPIGAPMLPANTGFGDTATALRIRQQELADMVLPQGKGVDVFRAIRDLTNALDEAVTNIEGIAVQLTNQVLDPMGAIRGMIATCAGIVERCVFFAEYIRSVSARDFSSKPDLEVTVLELLGIEVFRRSLAEQVNMLRSTALERRDAYLKQIQGDLTAQYIAREGEDLRDVASRFYGNPNEWRRIMTFNSLDGAELEAGQWLLIPKVNPQNIG